MKSLSLRGAERRSNLLGHCASSLVTSKILPICALDCISRCAAAASASGKVRSMTGRTFPASISGQTLSRKLRAIAALSATGRGQGRTGDRLATHHQMREVEGHLAALQKGNLHEPTFDRQRAQIL